MLYNIGMENKTDLKIVAEKVVKSEGLEQTKPINTYKKPLTPYQKYKQSKNKNGKKYFEFYDDVKVYTHNIYDW